MLDLEIVNFFGFFYLFLVSFFFSYLNLVKNSNVTSHVMVTVTILYNIKKSIKDLRRIILYNITIITLYMTYSI